MAFVCDIPAKPTLLAAPRITYMVALYPFLEQGPAFNRWDPKAPGTPDAYGASVPWCASVNSLGNDPVTAVVVPNLLCPSDGLGGLTSTRVGYYTCNHSNYLAFFGDANFGAILPGAVPTSRRCSGSRCRSRCRARTGARARASNRRRRRGGGWRLLYAWTPTRQVGRPVRSAPYWIRYPLGQCRRE